MRTKLKIRDRNVRYKSRNRNVRYKRALRNLLSLKLSIDSLASRTSRASSATDRAEKADGGVDSFIVMSLFVV